MTPPTPSTLQNTHLQRCQDPHGLWALKCMRHWQKGARSQAATSRLLQPRGRVGEGGAWGRVQALRPGLASPPVVSGGISALAQYNPHSPLLRGSLGHVPDSRASVPAHISPERLQFGSTGGQRQWDSRPLDSTSGHQIKSQSSGHPGPGLSAHHLWCQVGSSARNPCPGRQKHPTGTSRGSFSVSCPICAAVPCTKIRAATQP